MKNQYPYRHENRFVQPDSQGQVVNPYDQDSRLFQDIIQRNLEPVFVVTIDLGTAGSLVLPKSGFHFVQYGHDNSSNKTVNTTSLLNVWINQRQGSNGSTPFPAKHARGFSGPFAGLYIEWPAQTSAGKSVFCDLILFMNADKPWIDGESCT